MSFCLFTCIEHSDFINDFSEFVKTLAKTSGEYFLLVINCSGRDISDILSESGIENYDIVSNAINPGIVTALNQGMYFSIEKFSHSVYINSKYSLVISEDWLNRVKVFAEQDNFALGGTVRPMKITFSDKLNKLLYATNKKDPSWITTCTDRFMVASYVDGNIFVANNIKLKEVGFLNAKYHNEENYGIGLSFKFMEKRMRLTSIPAIYSSSKDSHRYDIGNKIKEGAGIVCPVKIKSVRDRLIEV